MPGQVQDAHRDVSIDNRGPGDDIRLQTVFPGTREEHQAVAGAERGGNRPGHFVHVLADTGALPERRAIIEQNPHARGIVARGPDAPAGSGAGAPCRLTPCESMA